MSTTPVILTNIEFELLLTLTHPSPQFTSSDIVTTICKKTFDQKKFFYIVKWHRVTPQVYQTLFNIKDKLPTGFFQRLEIMNQRCRMKSLKMSGWLVKVSKALTNQGIGIIALKGLGLSQQIYGNAGYRESNDVDIMVNLKDIDIAESTLFSLGFVRILPHAEASPRQIQFLNKHRKDREYRHEQDGTLLELHWRLFSVDIPFNPALPYLLKKCSCFTVHGEQLSTVSGTHLWIYQCLHGSISGWYRMRWICDIAHMLCFKNPDWDELLDLSRHYQCTNSLVEGIGLACSLYSLPIPKQLEHLINKNKELEKNIAYSLDRLRQMKRKHGISYIKRMRFWSPSSSVLKHILFHQCIKEDIFQYTPLPDKFFYVYYILRPFLLLYRKIIPSKRFPLK